MLLRFVNHSYQRVLCNLLVTLPSLFLLNSFEISELLNILLWQKPCPFRGVECGFVYVPLHSIYLSSNLVSGPVAVGIMLFLHIKVGHLLLGNDLAGFSRI